MLAYPIDSGVCYCGERQIDSSWTLNLARLSERWRQHSRDESILGETSKWRTPQETCRIELMMIFKVEIEQEEDGRWIAEVTELPGVLAYGTTADDARAKVQALALRVVADRLEHGEAGSDLLSISFNAA